jgi:hypothetical protein
MSELLRRHGTPAGTGSIRRHGRTAGGFDQLELGDAATFTCNRGYPRTHADATFSRQILRPEKQPFASAASCATRNAFAIPAESVAHIRAIDVLITAKPNPTPGHTGPNQNTSPGGSQPRHHAAGPP